MHLGVIADDFTGATDIASILVRGGMRVVQLIGVPMPEQSIEQVDAVVVALKSRSTPPEQAVAESLAALDWLLSAGAEQIFFKYCSTFDSTDKGNIGPVTDALMAALDTDLTVVCPAFPENGRTIFKGHLFVGDQLLSESPMRDHPLTPMRRSDLVELMSAQSAGQVGLVQYASIEKGEAAVRSCFDGLRVEGKRYAVLDAISDAHLMTIGRAVSGMALVTGGSGIALGLPANFGISANPGEGPVIDIEGPSLILAGSCSAMTRRQVANFSSRHPALEIDAVRVAAGEPVAQEALAWLRANLSSGPALIYSSADPEKVAEIQAQFGRERAGKLVEDTLSAIAIGAVSEGVRRVIVAGGETSGAVTQALGIAALRIGPEIAPGVPWTMTDNTPPLALALKSGNFGGPDFFTDALDMLP